MKNSFFLALASVMLLQGCVSQINRLPNSGPLPQPLPISSSTDFTHLPSHYTFPLTVAGFNRVSLLQYDTKGLDISAGYNDSEPGCPIAMTIYVSPTPRMSFIGADPEVVRSMESSWLNAAYNHWKQEIMQGHPRAVLQSEDERTQDGMPAKKAVYAIEDSESDLFVFVVDRTWFLTYRQTYPASCSTRARSVIQDFFSKWSGRAS